MVPIKFRLSEEEKVEYINKITDLMNDVEKREFSNNIKKLLDEMRAKGYTKVNELESQAVNYIKDYPTYNYLCMWLVLSSEEIESIKEFIYINYIKNDLDKINIYMQENNRKEINSYSALIERRKIKYKNNSKIKRFLRKRRTYDNIYDDFSDFITIYTRKFSEKNCNNWIVEKTGIKVCPYCNLAYTYNRGESTVAQLDHFLPKSEYPMFALCFYNLVPSCSACNHIKSDKKDKLISPYKDNAFKDFHISCMYSKNPESTDLVDLENDIKIVLKTSCEEESNNVTSMKLDKAYEHHKDYAAEIIKKTITFANKDSQKLISDMGKKYGVKESEIERFYFGNYMDEKDLEKRILSKLTMDLYNEYLKSEKNNMI